MVKSNRIHQEKVQHLRRGVEKMLKTLKDIGIKVIDQIDNKPIEHILLIESEELKKEAIEWIKELRDESGFRLIDTNDTMLCGEDRNGEHCCDEGIIRWIKHFFNILPEELKDE